MRLSIWTLGRVVQTLREVNSEWPMQQVAILLEIAKDEGVSQAQIVQRLGMTEASVSRSVMALSQYLKRNGGIEEIKGLDLVEARPSMENRRVLALYLTDKGRDLMNKLLEINGGGGN